MALAKQARCKSKIHLLFLLLAALVIYQLIYVIKSTSDIHEISVIRQEYDNTHDHEQYEQDKTCYLYMLPVSYPGNYYHFWQAIWSSMRISQWEFNCVHTIIYLPPRNNIASYQTLAQEIFGAQNVFPLRSINLTAIDFVLTNLASYSNAQNETKNSMVALWYHPLHNAILSANVSLNYTKYGRFGDIINFGQTLQLKVTGKLLNAMQMQYTYTRNNPASQQWMRKWRNYVITNVLKMDITAYNRDYYANHGYITIILRKNSEGVRNFKATSVPLLIRAIELENKTGRIQQVVFERLTLRKQLETVVQSTVLISAHGAGETNAMMMSPLYSIWLQICPHYAHCASIRLCPIRYQRYFSSYNLHGFASEIKDVNCSVMENKIIPIWEKHKCPKAHKLFRTNGLARDMDISLHSADVAQSIANHFTYLKNFNNHSSFSQYHASLRKIRYHLHLDTSLTSDLDMFSSYYCGKTHHMRDV